MPPADNESKEEEQQAPELSSEQQAIVEQLKSKLGEALLSASVDRGGALVLEVKAEHIVDLLSVLKNEVEPPISYLSDLHGIDGEETMAVIYHLFRPGQAFEVLVKAVTPRTSPQVPTATSLWPGACWPEREVMEMFGIEIVDHPDPRKLLLPEDWQGYPLRKDYEVPLDHPYLKPDALREDPGAVIAGEEPSADS